MTAIATSARPRVLFVDDDRLIRTAYYRQLKGRVDVATAESADEALAALIEGPPFAAVVTDLQMPGMDGLTLLARVRDLCPETVRVLFTGKADLRTAAQAVNDIEVFRILLKPCPPAQLWECIESSVARFEQHRGRATARTSEAAEAVSLLKMLVSETNPKLHARATRLRRIAHHLCVTLALPQAERLELAASLSGLGLIAGDRGLIDRFTAGHPGDDAERRQFEDVWRQTASVLERIHALRDVAAMVAAAAGALPRELSSDPVVLGAQVLRAAVVIDGQLAGGRERDDVLDAMRHDAVVPARLIDGLMNLPSLPMRTTLVEHRVAELETGMVLEDAVRAENGLTLVPAGRVVTEALIQLVRGYARTLGIVEPLLVRVTVTQPTFDDDDPPTTVAPAAAGAPRTAHRG